MDKKKPAWRRLYKHIKKSVLKFRKTKTKIKGNVEPSYHFLDQLRIIKESKGSIRVAEIGVDRGASSLEVIKMLNDGDIYDLFDMENAPFFREEKIISKQASAKLIFHKNSAKIFDSYSWELAHLYKDRISSEGDDVGIWDLVYLDGAHTFLIDFAATFFLKEMIKLNGRIIFDDMRWTLAKSPTCNTRENWERYTKEQMETPHVSLIVDLLMERDSRFRRLTRENDKRAVFEKIAI